MIPWKTRIGDIGESVIKSRLQRFSSVTNIERDVGIDFYCELITNNIPLTPFYVQAKSTDQINKKGNSIKKSTVQHWLSKPHPVYIIFYNDKSDLCYWESIEQERYTLSEKFFLDESKTITIKFDPMNVLDKSNNQSFINKIVEDIHSLDLYKGTPQFIGSGYVKRLPKPPRTIGEYNKIKHRARASLHSLALYHNDKGEIDEIIMYYESIALFDKSHFNHFAWLGNAYKAKNQSDKALENYKIALDICKRDKKWERNSMNEIITGLEREISSL